MSKKKTITTVLGTAMAFAASVMTAPPAAGGYPGDVQGWGGEVERWVRLGLSGGADAVASITDTQSDSENYDVSVSDVSLVQLADGKIYWMGSATGDAGWQVEWDRAATGNIDCLRGRKYQVVATFRWRLAGTTADFAGSPEERWSATYTCP
ncbi:hypothetical protein [Streptomyces sp. N35]|uniref:hypothetical protein n=1 Tax=Streptomyces sp. N35 TaxID=2795730 RepID=UPI001F48F560|nr:hypothetical protein [Streptomyces sp. N35]